ncbi:MAG: tRNA pseudouridine(38-40) synthase TruA [Acidimicrobiales bacterium]
MSPGEAPGGAPPPGDDDATTGRRRWRLLVAYDGAPFRGFAAQGPQVPTVAGALASALGRLARTTAPAITCAGRTDAGVHARGQVVHVDLPDPLPVGRHGDLDGEAVARALNRQLAPAVVVRSAEPAPAGFDARRSAVARRYRYLVWNAAVPDPLLAALAWHVAEPLDLRSMAQAADSVVGEHDFRGFCRRPPGTDPDEPIVRRVLDAGWQEVAAASPCGDGRLLRFEIEATSFCHQMVRSLVASLVGVGHGRGNVASVVGRLRSGTRAGSPRPAPAHGLCLEAVRYPN